MVKQSDDICSVTAREYLAVTRDVLDVWEDVYGRELGWFPPGVAVTLKDEYSHRSEYLVAYDDTSGSAVGTLRIVKGVYTPLPIERFVSLQSWLDPAAPKIELTRLMVKDRWRKRASPRLASNRESAASTKDRPGPRAGPFLLRSPGYGPRPANAEAAVVQR